MVEKKEWKGFTAEEKQAQMEWIERKEKWLRGFLMVEREFDFFMPKWFRRNWRMPGLWRKVKVCAIALGMFWGLSSFFRGCGVNEDYRRGYRVGRETAISARARFGRVPDLSKAGGVPAFIPDGDKSDGFIDGWTDVEYGKSDKYAED